MWQILYANRSLQIMCHDLFHKTNYMVGSKFLRHICEASRSLLINCHNLSSKPITCWVPKICDTFCDVLGFSFLLRCNLVLFAMFLVFVAHCWNLCHKFTTLICVTNLCVANNIFSCTEKKQNKTVSYVILGVEGFGTVRIAIYG